MSHLGENLTQPAHPWGVLAPLPPCPWTFTAIFTSLPDAYEHNPPAHRSPATVEEPLLWDVPPLRREYLRRDRVGRWEVPGRSVYPGTARLPAVGFGHA